jgi:hypothetical protein
MREMTFEMERILFLEKSHLATDNHLFISGLARAGTTILLRAVHASNEFASLSYADMPFVLAPNLWSRLSPTTRHNEEKERAHHDRIKVSTDSPEAFEEVFWQTFLDSEADDHFRNYVRLVLNRYDKKRYLSKNNQNIRRLDIIIKLFPDSHILIPFREPLQQAYSLLSQHLKFSELQTNDKFIRHYMDWIGHSEFGLSYRPIKSEKLLHENPHSIEHWLEQWFLVYSDLNRNFRDKDNVIFVCYESLCSDQDSWAHIKKSIGIRDDYDFEFSISTKSIDLEIDRALYDRCKEIYTELAHDSSLLS